MKTQRNKIKNKPRPSSPTSPNLSSRLRQGYDGQAGRGGMERARGKRRKILKFPPGFLWGTASSAYQVEGGNVNDWESQDRIAPAGKATDHYNRFEEDFGIAKRLHQNAHRLSLEWSRIEPERGVWNEEAIEHYARVLDFLKEKGFTTFVTLHHFTNPLWFVKQGGWVNKKSVGRLGVFADKMVDRLGELVDFWVTVNEPNVYALMCYKEGIWPPFKKNIIDSFLVYKHMLEAHNKVYDIVHAYYPEAKVGFAVNIPANEPYHKNSYWDKLPVKFADWASMDYPLMKTRYDYIGLNYYFHNLLRFGHFKASAAVKEKKIEITDKGWEIYPQGMYDVLLNLKKFKKPIYILENGIADASDSKRADFIKSYLKSVYLAIKKKVPVRGYFYWTLMDNYEWPVLPSEKTGYEMKFGLVSVDFAGDLKREIRKSAKVYAQICKNNTLITPPTPSYLKRGKKENNR